MMDVKNPMKYDIIPTTNGVYLSWRFEMSESVFSFLAQNTIIAIGNIDANTNEINSKTINLFMSNVPFSKDKIKQIIKNNGIQMIGGLVNVEIVLAIFNLFIILF